MRNLEWERRLDQLPLSDSAKAIAIAYGPDYIIDGKLVSALVNLIYSPEELTPEAVERAWQRVDRRFRRAAKSVSHSYPR